MEICISNFTFETACTGMNINKITLYSECWFYRTRSSICR
jgi:hypothetical protein